MITRLQLSGAPQGLEVAVAEGARRTSRGLAPPELDHLIAALLPDRPVVRLAEGRPTVRGCDDLHLSLSHAAGATALAVAPFPIGVDIECIDPELDALAIDPELFGVNDFAFVKGQAETAQVAQFYRLWTLKEARLKRLGRNLVSERLPDILKDGESPATFTLEGRIGADMSTGWLDRAGRRYCVGVCWGPA